MTDASYKEYLQNSLYKQPRVTKIDSSLTMQLHNSICPQLHACS